MTMTKFDPKVNGFAFRNSWKFDAEDKAEIRKVIGRATYTLAHLLRYFPFSLAVILVLKKSKAMLDEWIDAMPAEKYGLCGGMAFAALDYYHQPEIPFPRGTTPNNRPGWEHGAGLRRYILRRLAGSLIVNVPTFMIWMAHLHMLSWFGPRWLRKRTRKEWKRLKEHLDAGVPWPIGLVGTTENPSEDHQVVAYGYELLDGERIKLYVYDMNCEKDCYCQTITFSLDGETLDCEESCPNKLRGPLQGFFCEVYYTETPPDITGWP